MSGDGRGRQAGQPGLPSDIDTLAGVRGQPCRAVAGMRVCVPSSGTD